MDLNMGFGAFAVVIISALVLGVLGQMFLSPKTPYEWIVTAAGAGIGAWFGSEITWNKVFTGLADNGPTWDGLSFIPAVIGGVVLGAIFLAVARLVEAPAVTRTA